MPGWGGRAFRRSAFWMAASLIALFVGLAMFMHEQHAHDACAASLRGLGQTTTQGPPVCGFADTVYWAGLVVFASGALSLIGAMASAYASLQRAHDRRGPATHTRIWARSANASGRVAPPPDWKPPPPVWLRGLANPAPFEVPVRREHDLDLVDTGPLRANIPGDGVVTSGAGNAQTTLLVHRSDEPPEVAAPEEAPRADDPALTTPARPDVPAASQSSTPHPPPAWYPDPDRSGSIRWWDGSGWGESRPMPT